MKMPVADNRNARAMPRLKHIGLMADVKDKK
jgi:hypothetical protein